jgi:hypothetical protein
MSKYDELINCYQNSRKVEVEYKKACGLFFENFRIGLLEFLESPNPYFILFTQTVGNTEGEGHLPIPFMKFEDDAFYHIGIIFVVNSRKYLINLMLKRINDKFILRIFDEKQQYTLENTSKEGMKNIFEFIYTSLKESLENGFNNYLNQKQNNLIGFKEDE